jgi:hypothetical protein
MVTDQICVNCSAGSDEDTLYCVSCGYILPNALETANEATRAMVNLNPQGVDVEWGTSIFHHRAKLFLTIVNRGITIPVSLSGAVAIAGRTSVNGPVEINLAPYGASTLGVSRRHIRLDHIQDTIRVTDLASINGSYLNRERLVPGVPYTLRNRAVLQLSKLILRIQFA